MPSRNEINSLLRKLLEQHFAADPTGEVGMDERGFVVLRTGSQVWTLEPREETFMGAQGDQLAAEKMKTLPYPPDRR